MAYLRQDEEDNNVQPSLAPGNAGGSGGLVSGGTGYTGPVQRSTTNQQSPQQQSGSYLISGRTALDLIANY